MSNQQQEVFSNGPMTIQRSYSNIVGALNIARQKGLFSFRDSAFIFTSLQKMEEFIKQHDKPEPKTGPKIIPTPKKVLNIVDNDDKEEDKVELNQEKQPFAELLDNDNSSTNKENDEEEEIIEI